MILAKLNSLIFNHFLLNLARQKCFAKMILSLLECRDVNLSKIASCFQSNAKVESRYRRLQRFIKIRLDWISCAKLIVSILQINTEKMIIILDRTNWKFGKKHINFLYLAVNWKGVGIPLFWCLLRDKKQGNSNCKDRLSLVNRCKRAFGPESIGTIVGDREFIGKPWVEFLQKHRIPFVLRLKEKGQKIGTPWGGTKKIDKFFNDLRPGEMRSLGRVRINESNKYYASVTGAKLKNGDLLIVMHDDNHENPLETYRHRWAIECLFKNMKTGGFNSENTHVTDPDKLETLFAAVAIACAIAYKTGQIKAEVIPIKLKKHGWKLYSFVRYGLDCLQEYIFKKPPSIPHKPSKNPSQKQQVDHKLNLFFKNLEKIVV